MTVGHLLDRLVFCSGTVLVQPRVNLTAIPMALAFGQECRRVLWPRCAWAGSRMGGKDTATIGIGTDLFAGCVRLATRPQVESTALLLAVPVATCDMRR